MPASRNSAHACFKSDGTRGPRDCCAPITKSPDHPVNDIRDVQTHEQVRSKALLSLRSQRDKTDVLFSLHFSMSTAMFASDLVANLPIAVSQSSGLFVNR